MDQGGWTDRPYTVWVEVVESENSRHLLLLLGSQGPLVWFVRDDRDPVVDHSHKQDKDRCVRLCLLKLTEGLAKL